MAMQLDDAPHPYFGFIGNYAKPTWSDTAVAYLAFYHRLSKGATIAEAVEAMKSASGDDLWVCETAEVAKRGFIEYVQRIDLSHAQEQLEDNAESGDVPPGAKTLERGYD